MKTEVNCQSDLTDYSEDGRLSEHSDGKTYEWAKMIELSKRLGRPLTFDESEEYLITGQLKETF